MVFVLWSSSCWLVVVGLWSSSGVHFVVVMVLTCGRGDVGFCGRHGVGFVVVVVNMGCGFLLPLTCFDETASSSVTDEVDDCNDDDGKSPSGKYLCE